MLQIIDLEFNNINSAFYLIAINYCTVVFFPLFHRRIFFYLQPIYTQIRFIILHHHFYIFHQVMHQKRDIFLK